MKKRGFTLVELLVTIVIIALLGGVGIISYVTFFGSSEEKYYKSLESVALLAGNDYFLDHRDDLPREGHMNSIPLSKLVEEKYMEPLKKSNGEACEAGRVYIYKENNKYLYEACILCDEDYLSSGKYCNGKQDNDIQASGRRKLANGTYGTPYDVSLSYEEVEYSSENIEVTFSLKDETVKVTSYEIKNTKTGAVIPCEMRGNSCVALFSISGTYQVKAKAGTEVLATKHISVKITLNGPKFTVTGEEIVPLTCVNGDTERELTFKISKDNINEEYQSIKYDFYQKEYDATSEGQTLTKIKSGTESDLNRGVNGKDYYIKEKFGSGRYELRVTVTNFAGESLTNTPPLEFEISYYANVIYSDNDYAGLKDKHEVVMGQKYDYKEELPRKKDAYNLPQLDVRWFLNSTLINGNTVVTNSCTHTILGKVPIPVTNSGFEAYCKKVTYNGSNQPLVTGQPEHVTFKNTVQRNVPTEKLLASIDKPDYVWSDATYDDIPFNCPMEPKEVTVTADNKSMKYSATAPNYTYTVAGAVGNEVAVSGTATYTIKDGNTTITNVSTTDVGTYTIVPGGLTSGSNYKIKYVNGTLTINKADGYVNLSATSGSVDYDSSATFNITSHHGGTLSCATSDSSIATCSVNTTTKVVTVLGKKAGSATLTVKSAATKNYTEGSKDYVITVNKIEAIFACSDYTYDGTEKTGCTCTGCSGLSGTNKATDAGGPWTVTATADGNHYLLNASSQKVANISKTWKINKADATIECNSPVNYNGSSQNAVKSSSHCVEGITNNYVTDADTYTVTCKGGNNYTSPTCSFTINKVAAAFSCSDYNYDGTEKTGCTYSGCSISGTNKSTNAGSWEVTATADKNHYLLDGTAKVNTLSKTWKINKVAATFSCSDYTYDGTEKTGCSCSGCSMSGTNKATNAGGPWTVTATADNNHYLLNASSQQVTTFSKTWKINKAPATISCNDAIDYNGGSRNAVKSSSHCVEGITNEAPTSAGTYTVTCNGGNNYTSPTCSFTINQVVASFSCSDYNYDGSEKTGCSCSGCSMSGTNKSTNAGGPWTVTATADGNHYLLNGTTKARTLSKTWKINKVAATFSCSDYTYDGNEKTGCSCSGCSLSGTNKATAAGGPWTVTATADNNHYLLNASSQQVTTLSKTWKINKATATISCNDAITYDTKEHNTVKSSSHCVDGITNNYVTDADTYTVTCKGGNNYTSPTCSFTVNKATATIECNSAVTYNASSYYNAVKSSNHCVDGITNEKPTNAGTYTVTCNGGKNYTSPTCTFKVNQATGSFSCSDKTYDGNPKTGCSCTGCSRLDGTNTATNVGGPWEVTATVNPNYTIATTKLSWKINPATATFSCSDYKYDGKEKTGCTCTGCTITGGTNKATNVGGPWEVTASANTNYSLSTTKKSWKITKETATIECNSATNYTGKEINAVKSSSNCVDGITNEKPTSAGKYTVTCNGGTNYTSPTCSFTINQVAASFSCSSYTYDSKEKTGCSCSGCSLSGTNKATNAGGPWTVTATADGNHYLLNASSQQVRTLDKTWSISKAKATAPTLTATTATYTGSRITITKSGGTSGLTKEYSIRVYDHSAWGTWSSWGTGTSSYGATNVGSYQVRARTVGNENYDDSAVTAAVNLTIEKATAVAPTLTAKTATYTGSRITITKSGGTSGLTKEYAIRSKSGSSWGSWSSWGTGASSYGAVDAGNYQVKARTVGNENYNTSAETSAVALTINKANGSINCFDAEYTGANQTIAECIGGTIGGDYYCQTVGPHRVQCTADNNHNAIADVVCRINAASTGCKYYVHRYNCSGAYQDTEGYMGGSTDQGACSSSISSYSLCGSMCACNCVYVCK